MKTKFLIIAAALPLVVSLAFVRTWAEQPMPGVPTPGPVDYTRMNNVSFAPRGDITADGIHKVRMTPTDIEIHVVPSWGGGVVDVPAGDIAVNISVERQAPTDPKHGHSMRLGIVAMDCEVQSIVYPNGVVSGPNILTIDPARSSIKLDKTNGVSPLHGSARATLTDDVFSGDNPALVFAEFEGTYDFRTRQGTLTTLKISAMSPPQR